MRADDALIDHASIDHAWTELRIAILTDMWAGGATAAAIAGRLGLSRSAVLGKIFRLRCRASEQQQSATQTSCEPAALARRRPEHVSSSPRRKPRRKRPRPEPPPEPPRPSGISLLELTNDTCRFPHGEPGAPDFFFCGAPGADLEGGRPYCARHARLAYNSGAVSAEDDDEVVIPVRHSPSIAPFDSPRRPAWCAPANHPARRWR